MMRGSEEDKEKQTEQGPFIMQPGVCVKGKDGYAYVCVCSKRASGCVLSTCTCEHMCIPVWVDGTRV